MSVYAQILAIEVSLRGIDRIENGINRIVNKFSEVEGAARSVEGALKLTGKAVAAVVAGIYEASKTEMFLAQLEGLSGSSAMAAKHLKTIEDIASRGIFSRKEAFEGIRMLDKFGSSVADNIELVEKLGARTGNLAKAAELVGMIDSGYNYRKLARLKEYGIGPDKLREAGLVVSGIDVKGTPEQIIQALKKIEATDELFNKLQKTLASTAGALRYEFGKLIESLGAPWMGTASYIMGFLKESVKWMKDLNTVTNGWVGLFFEGGTLLLGLSKVVGFLKQIQVLEILIAGTAKIRAFWQAGADLINGLKTVISSMMAIGVIETVLLGIETVRAWVATAWGLAMANPGAVVAAGILIAAGIAGVAASINAVNSYRQANGMVGGESAANRPVRRDDIENQHKRMYANAWEG